MQRYWKVRCACVNSSYLTLLKWLLPTMILTVSFFGILNLDSMVSINPKRMSACFTYITSFLTQVSNFVPLPKMCILIFLLEKSLKLTRWNMLSSGYLEENLLTMVVFPSTINPSIIFSNKMIFIARFVSFGF
jgi:hypothetical protein